MALVGSDGTIHRHVLVHDRLNKIRLFFFISIFILFYVTNPVNNIDEILSKSIPDSVPSFLSLSDDSSETTKQRNDHSSSSMEQIKIFFSKYVRFDDINQHDDNDPTTNNENSANEEAAATGVKQEPGSSSAGSTGTTDYNQAQKSKERSFLGSFSFDLFGLEVDLFHSDAISNKMKETTHRLSSILKSSFSSSSSSLDNLTMTTTTNYVVFATKKNLYNVKILALQKEVSVCRFYDNDVAFCKFFAENFCHGMRAFDPGNRPFTALRILETLLICSALLSACYDQKFSDSRVNNSMPSSPSLLSLDRIMKFIFSILFSVFYKYKPSSLLEDLIALNIFVYPCLVTMDRLVALGTKTDAAPQHFFLSVFFLVVAIGGLSNWFGMMTSLSRKHDNCGLRGVAAASLGYVLATSPKKIVFRYMELEMNAGNVLLLGCVLWLIPALFGKERGFTSFVVWVVGGLAGNAMSSYQMDHYGIWWFPF